MILDMGLPRREGFQVLQELRSRGKTLPVLVLTGRRSATQVACLEAGADDHMTKPFRFDELPRPRQDEAQKHRSRGGARPERRQPPSRPRNPPGDRGRQDGRPDGARVRAPRDADAPFGPGAEPRAAPLSHVWGYSYDPTTNLVNVYTGSAAKEARRRRDPNSPRLRLPPAGQPDASRRAIRPCWTRTSDLGLKSPPALPAELTALCK